MVTALLVALAAAHPIHSSVATVTLESRRAVVTIRTFAEDFPPGSDSAAAERYLGARFFLSDRTGRKLPLRLRAAEAEGASLLLTLVAETEAGFGEGDARVWHGVLAERFRDQVNLVQVQRGRGGGGARSATLLFSAGDGPKPLP